MRRKSWCDTNWSMWYHKDHYKGRNWCQQRKAHHCGNSWWWSQRRLCGVCHACDVQLQIVCRRRVQNKTSGSQRDYSFRNLSTKSGAFILFSFGSYNIRSLILENLFWSSPLLTVTSICWLGQSWSAIHATLQVELAVLGASFWSEEWWGIASLCS